ncbi:MAG: hypothetical protein ABI068_00405 [Ktedonobacterales bacterium]
MTSAASLTPAPKPSRIFTVAWILLLLVGLLYIFAPILDLLADRSTGLPSDHMGAFLSIAGMSWSAAQQNAPGITHYITQLEIAYAAHELVFGILFIVIVAIPLRRRALWAWWTCWAVMLANITYSLTFGAHDPAILARSLIADIAVPVLLLVLAPFVFARRSQTPATA